MKLKMPTFMKMPSFRRTSKPRGRVMRATAARRSAQPAYDDYPDEDEEPTTRLSSAFIIVLLLHLVAVGGIYAFNGIKAHRRSQEVMNGPGNGATKSEQPSAAANPDAAYAANATPVPLSRTPVTQSFAPAAPAKHTVAANTPAAKTSAATATPKANTVAEQRKEEFLKVYGGNPPKTYKVQRGENPVAIARKLGVSYDELIKLNKIEDPKKLQVGQELKVPPKSAKSSTQSAG